MTCQKTTFIAKIFPYGHNKYKSEALVVRKVRRVLSMLSKEVFLAVFIIFHIYPYLFYP